MGSGPQIANREHAALLRRGVSFWNEWRKDKDGQTIDLSGVDLRNLDLTGADLRGVNLSNAVLRGARLNQGTRLWNANLSGADLYQTSFRGADLQDVNFSGADLHQADLTEANLQGADLSGARGGLLSRQLSGADLTGATLPEPLAKLYESLSSVKEISENAQKLFLLLLVGCFYSWLTIAQTTDVELITNRASTPLPVIQSSIPIVSFYLVAPVILCCLYFYFQFYLQKLWEELGALPAIFTDGRPLYTRTDPWLLNDLVRAHFSKLKEDRTFLSHFQEWLSIVFTWWLVPITLLMFWVRYLRRQDLDGTRFHVIVFAVAIVSAVRLYRLATQTLRGEPRVVFKVLLKRWSSYAGLAAAILAIVILMLLSRAAIFGTPGSGGARLFETCGFSPFANLREADVSVKPSDWNGKNENQLDLVKGANLNDRHLRWAMAYGAFLPKSQLKHADLAHIDLSGADLRRADLTGASLKEASLTHARLSGTNLQNTSLEGADLSDSDLSEANLEGARLNAAILEGANLRGAHLACDLQNAGLHEAEFKYADLRKATGLDPSMIKLAHEWDMAFYDPELLVALRLPSDHNEKLEEQMEAEQGKSKSK